MESSGQLKNNNIPVDIFKTLGDAYHQSYNFDKAIFNYEKYKGILDDTGISSDKDITEEINWKIDMCRVGNALNGLSTPINLKKGNQSKTQNNFSYGNYSSFLSSDQSKMTFTFKKNESKGNGPEEDLKYYESGVTSLKSDTPMVEGKKIKFDKKNLHEATVATSYDGQIILNYRDENGTANLYTTCLNGNTWTVPEKLNKPLNFAGWEKNESISADGNTMFFTSNRKGGYGGEDIYMCKKTEDGEWGKAENLGPAINTPFDEEAPFIHPDGVTLYFSSNGIKDTGKFEVYTSVFSAGRWNAPVNVGFPIDTTRDQTRVSDEPEKPVVVEIKKHNKKKLIPEEPISKTRDNYLVSFSNPNGVPLTLLKGAFVQPEGKISGSVKITVHNNETGSTNSLYLTDSIDHRFAILLPPAQNNNVTYRKDGYIIFSENIDLTQKNDWYEKRDAVVLYPIAEGASIVLNNIFFEAELPVVSQKSGIALQDLHSFLKNNPDLMIEVDNTIVAKQSIKTNSKLSQQRAESIVSSLAAKGIPKDRMIAKGTAMKVKRSPHKKPEQWMEMKITERLASKDITTTKSN